MKVFNIEAASRTTRQQQVLDRRSYSFQLQHKLTLMQTALIEASRRLLMLLSILLCRRLKYLYFQHLTTSLYLFQLYPLLFVLVVGDQFACPFRQRVMNGTGGLRVTSDFWSAISMVYLK